LARAAARSISNRTFRSWTNRLTVSPALQELGNIPHSERAAVPQVRQNPRQELFLGRAHKYGLGPAFSVHGVIPACNDAVRCDRQHRCTNQEQASAMNTAHHVMTVASIHNPGRPPPSRHLERINQPQNNSRSAAAVEIAGTTTRRP
jgi:hypothetical protein